MGQGSNDVHLQQGNGQVKFQFPSPLPDAYHYKVSYTGGGNPFVGSNAVEFLKRPQSPITAIASGTYNQSAASYFNQPLHPNSELYYYLDDGITPISIQKYAGPITISHTEALVAVTLKNHVYSDNAVYFYTITPPQIGGFGGGGGIINPTEPQITKDDNGNIHLDLKPDSAELLKQINTTQNEVVVEATSKERVDTINLELAGDVCSKV